MKEFFSNIFDTSKWPPRWYCGEWTDFHGWLYIISDLLIWASYMTMPLTILYFIKKKKKNIFFPKLYFYFGAFILLCGFTHLIDAVIFWIPIYHFSALMKAFTALISLVTIVELYNVLPFYLSLKSNQELEREIAHRELAEKKVAKKNVALERMNKVMIDRELKMVELKDKILELEKRLAEK